MTERHQISKHMREDRLDRAVFIATTIGYGKIIYERKAEERDTISCLTDTGVMIVKNSAGVIITMYIANFQQMAYCTYNNAPQWLINTIKKNEKYRKAHW